MGYSLERIEINRQNAQRSTGPKTVEGKANLKDNALKTGVESNRPTLPNENPEDYSRLLDNLTLELKPQGIIETTFVQRIALAMVRQQRIIKAENAYIALQQLPLNIADTVTEQLGFKVTEKDLKERMPSESKLDWCDAILAEWEAMLCWDDIPYVEVEKNAPHSFKALQGNSVGNSCKELRKFFSDLASTARGIKKRALILKTAVLIRETKGVMFADHTLTIQQTLVDNGISMQWSSKTGHYLSHFAIKLSFKNNWRLIA